MPRMGARQWSCGSRHVFEVPKGEPSELWQRVLVFRPLQIHKCHIKSHSRAYCGHDLCSFFPTAWFIQRWALSAEPLYHWIRNNFSGSCDSGNFQTLTHQENLIMLNVSLLCLKWKLSTIKQMAIKEILLEISKVISWIKQISLKFPLLHVYITT